MYNAIIEAIKVYLFLSLNVFPFLWLGYFLSKKGEQCEDDLIKESLGDWSIACLAWGLMMGIFWIMLTLFWLKYFLIDEPLTIERIKYLVNIIKYKI